MKAITIEDLKIKFVVARVAPYGEVIMVPGADFDPDWESVLEEEGFGCVFTEINSEKFVLVKLEKEEAEEETATEPSHVPKREDSGRFVKHRGAPSGRKINHWSDVDEERLLKRIEEMPRTITFEDKCAQLVSEFPGRTGTGLEKKYLKLKRLEKLRSRVGKALTKKIVGKRESDRLRDANKEQVRKSVEEEHAEPVSCVDPAAKLNVEETLTVLVDQVETLSNMAKIDHDIISRLNCAILLQAMETMERQGKLAIPPTLREHYLNALLQTWDKKAVETFNAKCRALMEASS